MKSKDAIKMFKHLNITKQQAQSLLDAKLTTSKRLTKYLKEVITPPPPKKSKPKNEKKEKKTGKEKKPAPSVQPVAPGQ